MLGVLTAKLGVLKHQLGVLEHPQLNTILHPWSWVIK